MTAALLLALLGCREDPGAPTYPDPVANSQDTGDIGDPNDYPGPDPFVGQDRLSFGVFYEGGSTDQLLVDELTVHYYIYEGSFTQELDLVDRVEGYQSDVLVQNGLGWFGGGVHSDVAVDLSGWTTLHASLKSAEVGDVELGMTGGVEARAAASDYGFAADGDWHHVAIPLADLTAQGVDLGAVTVALLIVREGGAADDALHVDAVYLSKE